jgi:hypothetical protein
VVAVAIERFYGVLLLSCNLQSRKLVLLEKIGLPENFMPTSLAFDNSCHLWMITGAAEVVRPDSMNAAESEAKGSVVATSAITCVRVIGLSHAGSDNLLKSTVLDDSAVQGVINYSKLFKETMHQLQLLGIMEHLWCVMLME